jgi:parallel beta-helix repeat protein
LKDIFLKGILNINLYEGRKAMNISPHKGKFLSVWIVLVFVGTCIIPAMAQDSEQSLPASQGIWLYVGGSGPGNYSKIQDALNASSDGDTVFVYSGVYYERIIIRNAIDLIGESKNTTIIDAINSDEGGLISFQSDNIMISGFTLRFNGDWGGLRIIILDMSPYDFENITISDNIFQANISTCIWLLGCDFCTITQNIFYLNKSNSIQNRFGNNWTITNNLMIGIVELNGGIFLENVLNCTISNNSIISTSVGLVVDHSEMNNISNNYFFNNSRAIILYEGAYSNSINSNRIDNPVRLQLYFDELTGISIESRSSDNIIIKNTISHCKIGIFLKDAYNTRITMNTFMNNMIHARFYNTLFPNHWNQNYWGRPRILPKPIFGIKDISHIYPGFVEFDWHPAKQPYII